MFVSYILLLAYETPSSCACCFLDGNFTFAPKGGCSLELLHAPTT